MLTGVYLLSHVYIVSGFDNIYQKKKKHQPKMDDYQPSMFVPCKFVQMISTLFVERMESVIRVSFPWIICCKNC